MNSYEEVSKDGLRKVVFTQVAEKSTKCEFFEEDLCLVEFEVQENVFNLSEATLSKRKYFHFAGNFITKGIDNITLRRIASILNYNNCNITIQPSKFFKFEIIGNKVILTIIGKFPVVIEHTLNDYRFNKHLIRYYKVGSLKKLEGAGYWKDIDLDMSFYTNNIGVRMSTFDYKNVTFVGCTELLKYFTKLKYLSKVDYFNTGNLFKDNTFTDNDKSFFAKVAFLRKKVLILNIEDDLSIMYKLID